MLAGADLPRKGQHLDSSGCVDKLSRIVLEKPIGHDLKSSREVNDTIGRHFPERNIYRIDHYLGKETVQNLLVLRFANRMINSQWDNSCIDHIQITAAETVGIEGRWSYYDKVGQLRDMVQNHLLQLLCMIAMEPPNSTNADEIRAEKVKLLRALSPVTPDNVTDRAVRGQYTAGWISGEPVVGYMEEEGSESDSSNTETFVALKTPQRTRSVFPKPSSLLQRTTFPPSKETKKIKVGVCLHTATGRSNARQHCHSKRKVRTRPPHLLQPII